MARLFAFLLLTTLSACQTIPAQHGFAAKQVAALQANGFERVDDHWELGLGDKLLFATDESELIPAQRNRLNLLSRRLVEVGIAGARVEGHTDSVGTADYNKRLSQRRADKVKAALVEGGMAAAAVRATGLGKNNPISSNTTSSGRQENRRVVILVSPADTAPL